MRIGGVGADTPKKYVVPAAFHGQVVVAPPHPQIVRLVGFWVRLLMEPPSWVSLPVRYMSTWLVVVAGMTRASPALRMRSLNLNTEVVPVFNVTVPLTSSTPVAAVYPFPEAGVRSVVEIGRASCRERV